MLQPQGVVKEFPSVNPADNNTYLGPRNKYYQDCDDDDDDDDDDEYTNSDNSSYTVSSDGSSHSNYSVNGYSDDETLIQLETQTLVTHEESQYTDDPIEATLIER